MEICGKTYHINTDFRVGIAYSSALLREAPVPVDQLLRLYFPAELPEDKTAALAAISDFLHCGEKPKEGSQEARQPPPYSFLTDDGAILAEFQRVYGIDLSSAVLHWWRFSALLRGLISHSFSERVKYRLADPEQIRDQHLRKSWREMKQAYALDVCGDPVRRPTTLEEYNEMLLAQARGERW